jgi:sugar phosphate isomerase/epimerase
LIETDGKQLWSQGFFLNVVGPDPRPWTDTLSRAADLLDTGHIEVWMEWVPSSPSQVEQLRRILDGFRLVVHAPFVGISLVGPNEEMRRASEQCLARAHSVASDLGAELITIHSGTALFNTGRTDAHDRLAESVLRLRDRRPGPPEITLENMADRRGVTYEPVVGLQDFAAMKARIPDLGFTLDVGHALQSALDPRPFIDQYRPSVRNVHLHDGVANGPAHLSLGTGRLDLRGLLAALNGYEGFVGLEVLHWDGLVESWDALNRMKPLKLQTPDA